MKSLNTPWGPKEKLILSGNKIQLVIMVWAGNLDEVLFHNCLIFPPFDYRGSIAILALIYLLNHNSKLQVDFTIELEMPKLAYEDFIPSKNSIICELK